MPSSRQLARKRQKRAAPKKGAQPVSPPLAPAPPSHVGRLNLLAFALYTAITLALGFDAILHLGDRIIGPGVGDNLWYAWSLWEGRSNVVAGQDPGHTHLIFALLPSVQIFVDAFFNEVIGWSLQTAVSPLAAYNITVLTTFVLT